MAHVDWKQERWARALNCLVTEYLPDLIVLFLTWCLSRKHAANVGMFKLITITQISCEKSLSTNQMLLACIVTIGTAGNGDIGIFPEHAERW